MQLLVEISTSSRLEEGEKRFHLDRAALALDQLAGELRRDALHFDPAVDVLVADFQLLCQDRDAAHAVLIRPAGFEKEGVKLPEVFIATRFGTHRRAVHLVVELSAL